MALAVIGAFDGAVVVNVKDLSRLHPHAEEKSPDAQRAASGGHCGMFGAHVAGGAAFTGKVAPLGQRLNDWVIRPAPGEGLRAGRGLLVERRRIPGDGYRFIKKVDGGKLSHNRIIIAHMPFLIDGHNLIPKIGLRLDSLDDELELVGRLNEFCRLSRKTGLEVYFDSAPDAQAGPRKIGLIKAHFIRAGLTADAAISRRLRALGRSARNWSVVTSDRQVQAEARSAGAEVISSEQFAAQVIDTLRAGPPNPQDKDPVISPAEVDEWLAMFSQKSTKGKTKL
jgi:uncharacterized protein